MARCSSRLKNAKLSVPYQKVTSIRSRVRIVMVKLIVRDHIPTFWNSDNYWFKDSPDFSCQLSCQKKHLRPTLSNLEKKDATIYRFSVRVYAISHTYANHLRSKHFSDLKPHLRRVWPHLPSLNPLIWSPCTRDACHLLTTSQMRPSSDTTNKLLLIL